jgi:hypothetical protein
MPAARPRSRAAYLALTLLVVALGLASRRFRASLPTVLGAYAGDALWAAMAFLLGTVLWNRVRTSTLLLGSLLFAFGIELSQLYHAPWIDAIRDTRLGGLVLGYDFVWSDLLCYTVGACAAAGLDLLLVHARKPWPTVSA